eukprot:scaffold39959_cov64-Attheya_sp.AAC.1
MEKHFPRTDGATAVHEDGTALKETKEPTVLKISWPGIMIGRFLTGVANQRKHQMVKTRKGLECLLGAAVFPCASECAHMKQCTPTFYDEV